MPDYQIEFQEATHTYKVNGSVKKSVTKVLPYNYVGYDTYSRDKGTFVHHMLNLYNNDDLNEKTLDPVLRPYLEAFKRFRAECGTIKGVIDYKTGVPHPCTELQLAGYMLLHKEGVNIKSLKPDNKGYEMILYHPTYDFVGTLDEVDVDNTGISRGYALYLKDDESYKIEDHSKNYRRNKGIFLSFLVSEQWKLEKGL